MKKKLKIPKFKSYEEEAEFWDTHSFADYWDDLKPVKVNFKASLKEDTMSLRLDSALKKRVENMANFYSIPASSLVRMWVVEKLRTLECEEAFVTSKKALKK